MNTFSVAGTSSLNGVTKVRYANDIMRIKNLAKGGHDNIDLIDLGRSLPKDEIAAYLQSINFADGNPAKAEAIAKEVAKRTPKAAPAAVETKPKVKVTKKVETKTKTPAKATAEATEAEVA